MIKLDFAKSHLGIAALGGLGTLALLGGEEEQKKTVSTMRPFPDGTPRLGIGQIGNKSYNLNNKEERDQYFKDLRKKQGIDEERRCRYYVGSLTEERSTWPRDGYK